MAPGERIDRRQLRSQATIDALIQATIDELDEMGDLGLRLESVVERAGASLSAIYHHFGDKDRLVDAARLAQFARNTAADALALRAAFASITSYDELMQALPAISAGFQAPERRGRRARRLANMAAAMTRPDYAVQLAAAQHRATEELVEVVEDLKARNIIGQSADSLALATFIQAYTLGHVVSDIDDDPLPASRWDHVVVTALRAIVPPPSGPAPLRSSDETNPASTTNSQATTARGQATARALIEAARRRIETRPDSELRIDDILAEVNVSPSSLYHYFGSREGLMKAAWLDWAQENAEQDVAAIEQALDQATTPDDAIEAIMRVVGAAQAPSREERRVQRLSMFAAAARRHDMRIEIGRLETETNHRYRRALEAARERGLFGADADLSLIPVVVRALTFGRVTNEMSAEPVDADAWTSAVDRMVRHLFGSTATS